jgi:hypothetical protein
MKFKFIIYSLFISCLTLTACSNSSDSKEQEGIDEALLDCNKFSLKSFDIPATILLPDETSNIGASTKVEVTHTEGDFLWDLKVGPNFELVINDWGNDKEILNAEVKKLKNLDFYNVKFLKKTATTLLYERTLNVDGKKNASKNVGIEHKSYHLFMTKTIQNIIYTFETNDGGSTKEIIELQEKCINSIHEINNSKNS